MRIILIQFFNFHPIFGHCPQVQRLLEYLDQSVKEISQDIAYLSEGVTDFESKAISPDEWTKDAYENFKKIHASINTTRFAIKKIIEDSQKSTQAAQDGNLSYRSDPQAHEGEFRSIIKGLNNILDLTLIPINEAMRVSHEYAKYNFKPRFNPTLPVKGDWIPFKDALDEIGDRVSDAISILHKKVQDLSVSIEEANSSVEEISSGTQEISTIMDQVSENSKSSNVSISQIINAMEDLIHTVGEVSQKADSVAGLSQQATASAQLGMEKVKNTEHSMNEIILSTEHVDSIIKGINAEMNEIGKIVRAISDIANQTNLLSLNAAIEAARAGEAGKGFAVVASEVKSLAQDSRKSAENITEMISVLQQKTKSAEEAMTRSISVVRDGNVTLSETIAAFTHIAATIDDINKHILDVASATEEQAASVEEVTASMQEVSLLSHKTSEELISTSVSIRQTSTALDQINKVVNNVVVIGDGVNQELSYFSVL
ncbi:hypothetical protein DLD82_08790 [Methanospirillum stamsii]|uniref:Methyl-accepting transducer domain-containing protein n=1 Tax=Methanospirillum stamsii TaxID=1277351 RepID=A0A2V2N390_9EURY|nr:hypothetical protein DLD82_08790 [Methanospirillum stamsii]